MPSRRTHGTGHLYEKSGSYYARWRTPDGRLLNRKLGKVRSIGERDGLTRTQAEREFRRQQEAEEHTPRPRHDAETLTVDTVANSLRERLELRGRSKSYRENCEYMQRVHISPFMGERRATEITTDDIEALTRALLKKGLAPKTVRNILGFLHAVFEHGIDRHWLRENPARRVEKPGRQRKGANPDLQFLTVDELEAVLRAIPDEIVVRRPSPTRKGRRGPAPPPSPDVLGPVLRRIILAAAMTGLRQSELIGLRWRDIDWAAQRIRVRKPYVRGQHTTDGKSELSTRRSVPLATRLARELDAWSRRSPYNAEENLVFAHPTKGTPLDGSKVNKRFKDACRDAGVRVIKFHDLRHTFATRLAASNTPIRTIQEFLGHADSKTTQIYAHYAPSEQEVQLVDAAFAPQFATRSAEPVERS
jgi:integrase